MRSKIIFSLLGMILLIGSAIAGGIVISERATKISELDKDTLIKAGIKEVSVSKVNCSDDFCYFNIKKGNTTTKQKMDKYKFDCVMGKKLILDCTKIEKTEIDLMNERDMLVDNYLTYTAKTIVNAKAKAPSIEIGTAEKVTISSKEIGDKI